MRKVGVVEVVVVVFIFVLDDVEAEVVIASWDVMELVLLQSRTSDAAIVFTGYSRSFRSTSSSSSL
jgi:hypothetical protein